MDIREMSRIEKRVVNLLIKTFDFVVLALGAFTMIIVVYMLFQLSYLAITNFNVETILQGIVLILIFLEILEIISMYVAYHHVQMRNIVEIGVLALVKEFLTTLDIAAIGWETLLALSALIFVMGWIYVQERKRIDEGRRFLAREGLDDTGDLE
jgi:uncharacterized membrane protein (DUF373 family)